MNLQQAESYIAQATIKIDKKESMEEFERTVAKTQFTGATKETKQDFVKEWIFKTIKEIALLDQSQLSALANLKSFKAV